MPVLRQISSWIQRPGRKVLAAAVALVGSLGAGVVIGDWMSDNQIKGKLVQAVRGMMPGANTAGHLARQEVEWAPLASNLHDLEMASYYLAPFKTLGRGGAIEEIAGSIVFASPVGGLGYVGSDGVMHAFEQTVPMNSEALDQSEISNLPGFLNLMFRVLDLLAVERAEGGHDLYVSHHRFAGTCFEIVVSRVTVMGDGSSLAVTSDWQEVFVANPCIAPKPTGMVFEGNESGGRMALAADGSILLALGDLQFNGVDDTKAYAQDPAVDPGKIIAIDPVTGAAAHVSSGHRNPQGLLVDREGKMWATEHGPQGGDELNAIQPGGDYGWPRVTYGINYAFGGGRRGWPANPVQGRHDDFLTPAFAFVPSISISALIQPDPDVFPLWRDHLVIGALYSGQSLYLTRIEADGRVAYVEPVKIDKVVRDMISLKDGRIAILTDAGELVLIRNAEHPSRDGDDRFAIVASDTLATTLAATTYTHQTPEQLGEEIFTFACASCHSMSGVAGLGPPLDGLMGRHVGGHQDYRYSAALAKANTKWNRSLLGRFLADPQAVYPGTTMPQTDLNDEHHRAIIAFFNSQR